MNEIVAAEFRKVQGEGAVKPSVDDVVCNPELRDRFVGAVAYRLGQPVDARNEFVILKRLLAIRKKGLLRKGG